MQCHGSNKKCLCSRVEMAERMQNCIWDTMAQKVAGWPLEPGAFAQALLALLRVSLVLREHDRRTPARAPWSISARISPAPRPAQAPRSRVAGSRGARPDRPTTLSRPAACCDSGRGGAEPGIAPSGGSRPERPGRQSCTLYLG